MKNNLEEILKEKILILDGAMGTLLKKYKLNSEDFCGALNCYEILNKTRTDIIKEIHEKYILAGADIIETNSFNCNLINLEKYSLEDEVYNLAKKSVEIAKEAAKISENKIYIFGAVGPTNRSLSFLKKNKEINFEKEFLELKNIFKEQISGLIDGGVDAILIETVYDKLNTKASLVACEELFKEKNKKVPIFVSMTVDKNGDIGGEKIENIIRELDNNLIIGFGVNCSFGSKNLFSVVERIKKATNKFIIFYPNAGIPNENGEYPEDIEEIKTNIKPLLERKLVNIIGGCCGTDFEYIKNLKKLEKNACKK